MISHGWGKAGARARKGRDSRNVIVGDGVIDRVLIRGLFIAATKSVPATGTSPYIPNPTTEVVQLLGRVVAFFVLLVHQISDHRDKTKATHVIQIASPLVSPSPLPSELH